MFTCRIEFSIDSQCLCWILSLKKPITTKRNMNETQQIKSVFILQHDDFHKIIRISHNNCYWIGFHTVYLYKIIKQQFTYSTSFNNRLTKMPGNRRKKHTKIKRRKKTRDSIKSKYPKTNASVITVIKETSRPNKTQIYIYIYIPI